MADRVIKTTIQLDGEKAFKSALQSVNSEMKVFDSELKLVTAEFGKTDQGMKGLQATADVLTKKVEAQKAKVEALKGAVADSGKAYDDAKNKYAAAEKKLEEMTAQFGENSEEARRAAAELNSASNAVNKAEQSYNNYQVQLNNTQAELIKTTDKLKETSAAAKDLKNLKLKDLMPESVAKKVEEVAKAFGKVATEAGKAAAAAAKIGAQTIKKSFEISAKALTAYATAANSAATAIIKLTGDAASAADELNTMSKQTGLSTEELQKMQYAANLVDVNVETITGSMAKLTKNMTSSSKQTTAAFEKLGVSVRDDVTGELRNNQDVFNDLINALGEVENETERDNLAMQVFGKSAQELNPLILGGADALKKLGDQAEASGLILSQDALDGLNAYNDSLDVMKANASSAGRVIATEFAPKLSTLTNRIGSNLPNIANAFGKMFSGDKLSGENFRKSVGSLVDGLLSDINKMLPDFLSGFNTVILTIADNVPKIVTELLPSFITGLTDLVKGLVDEIPTLLPDVIQFGSDLFIGLIGGLNEVIDKLMPMLPGIVKDIGDKIIEDAPKILDTGITLLTNLIDGITETIPTLVDKATELIPAIVKALTDNIPRIIAAGIKLITELAKSLPKAIPEILAAIPPIINAIINGLKEVDWKTTGEEIFRGLGGGLQSIFSGALGIIDELFGTNLQKWYDEVTAFWFDAGAKLYEVLHADEIKETEAKSKATDIQREITYASNEYMRQGMSSAEALEKAKNEILDTAEEIALFNQYLKDEVTEANAAQRLEKLRASSQISGMTMSAQSIMGMPSNVPTQNINNYTFNNSYNKKATAYEQKVDMKNQMEVASIYG